MEEVEKIITELLDILEEFLDSFKLASGQKILQVLGILYAFLAFSLICLLLGKPTFVSWIEAALACLIMTGVCCINYINKNSINNLKKDLKDKIDKIKYKEGEVEDD